MELDVINKRIKILSDLQDEINRVKAACDESLENDPQYQEIQEQSQKFKEEIKDKKVKVNSNQTIKSMTDQIKELRNEIKENKEILAQELADYYKESGSLQIVDDNGATKRIIFSAKLVND